MFTEGRKSAFDEGVTIIRTPQTATSPTDLRGVVFFIPSDLPFILFLSLVVVSSDDTHLRCWFTSYSVVSGKTGSGRPNKKGRSKMLDPDRTIAILSLSIKFQKLLLP